MKEVGWWCWAGSWISNSDPYIGPRVLTTKTGLWRSRLGTLIKVGVAGQVPSPVLFGDIHWIAFTSHPSHPSHGCSAD